MASQHWFGRGEPVLDSDHIGDAAPGQCPLPPPRVDRAVVGNEHTGAGKRGRDAAGLLAATGTASAASTGQRAKKVEPTPTSLSTPTLPPIASTMR